MTFAAAVLLALPGCSIQPIEEALDARCEAPDLQDPDGDLHAFTLDRPAAVCNDGSPAVVYLRAASAAEHADDWVVYLSAGSGCGTEKDCTARWCDTRRLMSSRVLTETDVGVGILDPDPEESPFATWNVASLAYCTSDYWTGTNPEAELRGGRKYTLAFRGNDVVEAVLDALDEGAVSDDGAVEVPPLDEADRFVLAGASAGGHGVLQHLDRLADRYAHTRFTAIVDAPMFPAPGTLPDVEDRITKLLVDTYEEVFVEAWDAKLDDSCQGATDGWPCTDMFRLERDHIQARFLLRHDLYDPVGGAPFLDLGTTRQEYAAAGEVSARRLAEARPDLGILGPACGDHIVAVDPLFSKQQVRDALAPDLDWTFASAAGAWESHGKPMVAIDTPEAEASYCH